MKIFFLITILGLYPSQCCAGESLLSASPEEIANFETKRSEQFADWLFTFVLGSPDMPAKKEMSSSDLKEAFSLARSFYCQGPLGLSIDLTTVEVVLNRLRKSFPDNEYKIMVLRQDVANLKLMNASENRTELVLDYLAICREILKTPKSAIKDSTLVLEHAEEMADFEHKRVARNRKEYIDSINFFYEQTKERLTSLSLTWGYNSEITVMELGKIEKELTAYPDLIAWADEQLDLCMATTTDELLNGLDTMADE